MKTTVIFALLVCLVGFSCKQATPVATTVEGDYFGAQFEVANPISVEKAIEDLATNDTLNVQLGGLVQSVCKSKGCWTNIASNLESEDKIFVKFKDYGFFLPLDCEGQEIVLEGKAYMEVTSVDELRHYAEDENKSQEEIDAINEPAKELKFMASGAYLKKKKS